METEIQDELIQKYERLYIEVEYIEVEYKDIRKYLIIAKINKYETKFIYIYDAKLTFDANVSTIEQEIDKRIIKYYKGE